jgi:energy-coupling factor transporter ATP-binding protein EcfA2
MKKIIVITGHYGCGKTNFAANLAVRLADEGGKVAVADLDIVNPYFRAENIKTVFDGRGINFAAPRFANSNLDIPALSFDPEGLTEDGGHVIIDVGGDSAGARALGRYARQFAENAGSLEISMLYVINMYRYLTKSASSAAELLREIEAASKLTHTGIVNNSNLSVETTAETVLASRRFADEVSETVKLPIAYTTLPLGLEADVINPFPVLRYVRNVWELPTV